MAGAHLEWTNGITYWDDVSIVNLSGTALTGTGVEDEDDDDVVPTPLVYFATHYLDTGSGIAVTGSHNPPDYNGLKIMLGGETLAGDAIQALRQRLLDNDLVEGDGSRRSMDVIDAYIDRVVSDITLARPLRIAIDCGNGVAGAVALRLPLGVEVIHCHGFSRGNFIFS